MIFKTFENEKYSLLTWDCEQLRPKEPGVAGHLCHLSRPFLYYFEWANYYNKEIQK